MLVISFSAHRHRGFKGYTLLFLIAERDLLSHRAMASFRISAANLQQDFDNKKKTIKKVLQNEGIRGYQKLLDQLIQKKYVERGEKDGSWRVFVTQ